MVSSKAIIFRRIGYLFIGLLFVLTLVQVSLASTIGGFVYDQRRNPVVQVDVELLNENYFTRARVKTDGLGRYQFSGLSDGRYYIRVLPFRFNLQDQTQEVIVNTLSILGSGNMNFEQDFYLARKEGGLGDTVTGVVFAQEVPKEAEKLYEDGEDDLSNDRTVDGIKKMLAAIKIFPMYYAATQRLGIQLLTDKRYMDAAKLFIRAAEINPKSSRAFYYMGFSLNKLGDEYNKAALKALEKAAALATSSWEIVYLIGKIERQEGNYAAAEKFLLKSKKLADVKIPEIHIELAQLYGNDLKQYDKAADELEQYMKSSKKKDENIKKKIADLRNKAKKIE
jgi:hypothetical protein